MSILLHTLENTLANKINAAHQGKDKHNVVKYIMAFLYSDWLYFLSHGIKSLCFKSRVTTTNAFFKTPSSKKAFVVAEELITK